MKKIWILGVLMLLANCVKTERKADDSVRFKSRIGETRAYETMWEGGDQIGVWMVSGGGIMGANKRYVAELGTNEAAGNANFRGADAANTLEWPTGTVDFVAYWPWRDGGDVYEVDVRKNQTDLMWSGNATGRREEQGSVTLVFEHKMAAVVFNVADAGGESLAGMRATIGGMALKAEMNLMTGEMTAIGEKGTFEAKVNPAGTKVEAIVVPDAGTTLVLTMTLANGEEAVFETTGTFAAGKRYTYELELTGGGGTVASVATIEGWDEIGDNTVHEVEKRDENGNGGNGGNDGGGGTVTTGEKGETLETGVLTEETAGVEIEGGEFSTDGLLVRSGDATVTMKNYAGGVETVTLAMVKGYKEARVAVTVGGTALEYDGGTEATVSATGDYTFRASGEGLPTGKIVIAVMATGATVTVAKITVN